MGDYDGGAWNKWHVAVPCTNGRATPNVVDYLHYYYSHVRSRYYHWCNTINRHQPCMKNQTFAKWACFRLRKSTYIQTNNHNCQLGFFSAIVILGMQMDEYRNITLRIHAIGDTCALFENICDDEHDMEIIQERKFRCVQEH